MPTLASTSSATPFERRTDRAAHGAPSRRRASAAPSSLTRGKQDTELVAAEARDGVARRAAARVRRLPISCKQQVAVVVAERVVDLLEAVEVEQQQARPAPAVAASPRIAWLVRSWKRLRFGSSGERVVERQVLVLGSLAAQIVRCRRRRVEALATMRKSDEVEQREPASRITVQRLRVMRDRRRIGRYGR